ncbi:ribosomal protein S10 [Wolffia australiana]
MASRALSKWAGVRGHSSSIFRSMNRELSSPASPGIAAAFQRRDFIVCRSSEFPPLGVYSPVAENFRSKHGNFMQDVRWWGSRSKFNDTEEKKSSWTCPKCGTTNKTHHQRCTGCQEPDSIAIRRSPTFGFSLGADSQNTSRVALPRSIVKFCVNRSPHIDKKSREQFEMRISKLYMVVKTRSEDLQRKLFWLKRQRILGAQYELIFSYKTRLPLKPPVSDNP